MLRYRGGAGVGGNYLKVCLDTTMAQLARARQPWKLVDCVKESVSDFRLFFSIVSSENLMEVC